MFTSSGSQIGAHVTLTGLLVRDSLSFLFFLSQAVIRISTYIGTIARMILCFYCCFLLNEATVHKWPALEKKAGAAEGGQTANRSLI